MKVIWTIPAKKELRKIYDYYKKEASEKVAKSVKNKILKSTHQLMTFNRSAQKEELLSSRQGDYRYLVVSNYKVIYKTELELIYVLDVFDTRQNPEKLKRVR